MTPIASLTNRPAWKALTAHYQAVQELHLRKLLADDPKRGERMGDKTCPPGPAIGVTDYGD
jgi:hypothetical protein